MNADSLAVYLNDHLAGSVAALELIFEARREDFTGPTTEALLEEVGLTPGDVADLMDRVKHPDEESV